MTKTGLQNNCRICEGNNLESVISLGNTPLANNLLTEKDLNKEDEKFPLELMYCNDCYLSQLSYVVPPEKMFQNYLFVTSTMDSTRKHFKEMADKVSKDFQLNKNSLVVDIGSNDGILLDYFQQRGTKILGIEPAKNISEIAIERGIDTLNSFFDKKSVEEIIQKKGLADIVTATNVFAHVNDIGGFVENAKNILKKDGVFIVEAQYLLDTIRGLTFDNIYHEHVSYFSFMPLDNFFKRHGMEMFKVEYSKVHGGSIRAFTQRSGGRQKRDSSVDEFIEAEKNFGLKDFSLYKEFARKVNEKKERTRNFILELKNEGKKIVGYGAPAKATTALNFYQINNEHLDYIIEDNPLKHGKIVPGVRIPIYGKDKLETDIPDYIYILAWNYTDEILKNNESSRKKGVKFIVPYPELKII